MRQPVNPRNHDIREFILGAILVLVTQIVLGIFSIALIVGMIGVIDTLHISTPDVSYIPPPYASLLAIAGSPFLFIGITQIAYLAPIIAYFAERRRHEVNKGILFGAIVTLLINSACFASPNVLSVTVYIGIGTYGILALIIAIALLISGTIGWFGVKWVNRSRPK
jgi:hypothetical protein